MSTVSDDAVVQEIDGQLAGIPLSKQEWMPPIAAPPYQGTLDSLAASLANLDATLTVDGICDLADRGFEGGPRS